MGTFVSYTIIVSVAMLTMAVVYRWLMSADKQPALNRAVLLTIYALASASPFLADISGREPSATQTDVISGSVILQTIAEQPSATPPTVEAPRSVVPDIVVYVYVAGAVFMLLHTAAIWLRLWRLVRGGRHERIGRYTLVVTDTGGYTPFSWLHYIVISEEDYRSDTSMIITHEMKHLDMRHPLDMILSQLAVIVLWYTPAPYMMRDELRSVHEYQADMAVIRSGADMRSYQLLLIRKAVGKKFPALANSLNHSKLKNRITMMMKKQSSKSRRMRVLAVAPALAVALAAVNLPVVASALQSVTTAEAFAKVTQNSEPEKTVESKTVTVNGSGLHIDVNGQPIDRQKGAAAYFVDGRQISEQEAKAIDPIKIKSVDVKNDGDTKLVIVTMKTPEEIATLDSIPRGKMKVISSSTIKKDDVVVEIDGRITTVDELNRLDPHTISSIEVKKGSPAHIIVKLKPTNHTYSTSTDSGLTANDVAHDIENKGKSEKSADIAKGIADGRVVVTIDDRSASTEEYKALDLSAIKHITVKKGNPTNIMICLKSAVNAEEAASRNITIISHNSDNDKSGTLSNEFSVVAYGTFKKDDTTDSGAAKSREEIPQFPGGEAEMMRFLANNLVYPSSEINGNASSKLVVVQFVVKADGSISNPVIARSQGKAFDNEALRVVRLMPRFTPGKKNGTPVDTKFALPITFAQKGR